VDAVATAKGDPVSRGVDRGKEPADRLTKTTLMLLKGHSNQAIKLFTINTFDR
jgi:hypothetical protein